jgi:mannose-6-phosphate isomerase-like protein (cupin superfamily)
MSAHAAPALPVRTDKPWGHELLWARVPDAYAAKIIHVLPGCRLSLQYHRFKSETMYVLSGTALITLGDATSAYGPGQFVHIPVGVVHRLAAPEGDAPAEVLEVSTDHLDDVVRLVDDYGR